MVAKLAKDIIYKSSFVCVFYLKYIQWCFLNDGKANYLYIKQQSSWVERTSN
jgi:hypothetical protein